jgi:putative ABC transport system substrate-binding protein
MQRRKFIALLGGATVAGPIAARSQQRGQMQRIGVLMGYAENDPEGQARLAAFRDGLRELGWTEGRNIWIDYRWAASDIEAMQRFAKELVALQPDLIFAAATPATAAMVQQTRSIPIIFAGVSDPVGSGFVESFPRPGRQRHRFHHDGAYDGRQVARAAQGDCAERGQGRPLIQLGNGDICRILA